MSETYTIGGDTLYKFDSPDLAGQSFMPMEDHILEYIDLQLRGPLILPEPVILVYDADILGHPFGDYISRSRYIVEKHSGLFTTGRVRFSMQAVLLDKGSRYVITAGNYPPLGGTSAYWQYDKDDATYPRGHRISTPDGGATWVDHWNDDHIFCEFGTPPLPKPDPPPPIEHFAVPSIPFYHFSNAILTIPSTTVPCHLTCYWTDKKPLKHHTSRIVRGLTVPWGTYFCFVAWHAVEQTEQGDTLYHTFNLSPWQECQTRWFTFRGEVDFKLSPSVGPIFEHHHSGIGPPQTEEQPAYDTEQGIGYGAYFGQGQRLVVTHREVTKLGFWLSRRGTGGPGTVSFKIIRYPSLIELATKDWGLASTLPLVATYEELTLDTPIYLNEEVIITMWNIGGDTSNCAVSHYQHSDVKADENLITFAWAWVESPAYDCAYRYTYHQ